MLSWTGMGKMESDYNFGVNRTILFVTVLTFGISHGNVLIAIIEKYKIYKLKNKIIVCKNLFFCTFQNYICLIFRFSLIPLSLSIIISFG